MFLLYRTRLMNCVKSDDINCHLLRNSCPSFQPLRLQPKYNKANSATWCGLFQKILFRVATVMEKSWIFWNFSKCALDPISMKMHSLSIRAMYFWSGLPDFHDRFCMFSTLSDVSLRQCFSVGVFKFSSPFVSCLVLNTTNCAVFSKSST